MPLPPLARVRLRFDTRHVAGAVRREFERALPEEVVARIPQLPVLDSMRAREPFEEPRGSEDALDASGALVPFGGCQMR